MVGSVRCSTEAEEEDWILETTCKKFLDLVTLGTLGCSGFESIFSALVYVMLLNGIFSKMPCPTFCLCEIGFSCWETLRNTVGHMC